MLERVLRNDLSYVAGSNVEGFNHFGKQFLKKLNNSNTKKKNPTHKNTEVYITALNDTAEVGENSRTQEKQQIRAAIRCGQLVLRRVWTTSSGKRKHNFLPVLL